MKPTTKAELEKALAVPQRPAIDPLTSHNAVMGLAQMYGATVQALQMRIDQLERENAELKRRLATPAPERDNNRVEGEDHD